MYNKQYPRNAQTFGDWQPVRAVTKEIIQPPGMNIKGGYVNKNFEIIDLFFSKKQIWHIPQKDFDFILSSYFQFFDPKFIWFEPIDDDHIETFIDRSVIDYDDPWDAADNPYYIAFIQDLLKYKKPNQELNQKLWPKTLKTRNKWIKIYKLMKELDNEYLDEDLRKPTYKDYADRLAENNEFGYLGRPYTERLLREIKNAGLSESLN